MGGTVRRLWAGVVLLAVTGASAGAASGDLLWSEARVAGSAQRIAVGAGALAVFAQHPAGTAFTIRVYDPATGNLRRSFARQRWITDVLVRGGLIVVSEGSDLVAIHRRSGRERWREPLGGSASLVGAGARIFAATENGVLTAHALRTGKVLWTNDDGPVSKFVVRYGRIAAAGTRQGAGQIPRLVVRVLSGRTGAEAWSAEETFDSARGADGRCITWADSRILVGGRVIRDYPPPDGDYYDDSLVVAYDATSGRRLWLDEVSAAADRAVVGLATREEQSFALISRSSGSSYDAKAYDARTGQQLWDTGPEPFFIDGAVSGPLVAGDTVIFGADAFGVPSGFLATALASANGAVAWEAAAQAGSTTSYARDIATDGSRLFVAGSAFDANATEPMLAVWAYSLD
jgi:outer membrane protein assembly factor BamB